MEKSIEIWRDLGWRCDLGRSLYSLGKTCYAEQKYTQAFEKYNESLEILQELGAKLEIDKVKKSIEELNLKMKSDIAWRDPSVKAVVSEEKTRDIFYYLVKSFIQDSIVDKFPIDKSGWRSLGDIEKEANVPRSFLYAKTGGAGPGLKLLLQSKLVESAIFSGERGRGGEITRVRLAYSANSPIVRELVEREIRNKSPELNRV